jgi:hypothetical protein
MTTKRIKQGAFLTDVWLYRMIVGALGLAILVCLVGAIALAADGQSTPDLLVALGFAAAGSLGGLLAPSPLTKQ